MINRLLIWWLLLLLISCSTYSREDINPALVSWKSEFVMEDGEQATGYYMDRNNFIKPYINKEYTGDTLRAETLHEINSCGKTVGDVKFSNDTLYLITRLVSNEECSSVVFCKFRYVIVKKDISSYIISY